MSRRSNPSSHRTWIFDFDGTLIDSMETMRVQAGTVIAHFHGLTTAEGAEQYRQTTGLPFVEQVALLFPNHPSNADAVHAFEEYKCNYLAWAQPFPETHEVLTQLRQRGDYIAVSSNNLQSKVDEAVKAFDLPVDLICGWHDGSGKGTAHFHQTRERSGCHGSAPCFVGDSLHDARLARDHGLDFIGRAGTFSPQEFLAQDPTTNVVSTLRELL